MIEIEVFEEVLGESVVNTIIRETLSTLHMIGTPEDVLPSLLDDLAYVRCLEALREIIDSQIAIVTASSPLKYELSNTVN